MEFDGKITKKKMCYCINKYTKLGKEYSKLINKRQYKGQYHLIRQIKPILIKIKKYCQDILDIIEENELIRKENKVAIRHGG